MEKPLNTARLNEYYNVVADFVERYNNITEQFQHEEGIEEAYQNPFHTYELKHFGRELKNKLINFIIQRYRETFCPNVTIDVHGIETAFNDKGFNADEIVKFLTDKYLINAEKLSYDEILREARKLLPVFWDNHSRREPEVSDIVKKDTLILRKYVSSYDKDSYSLYDHEGFSAIEKLIRIVINKDKAKDVKGASIAFIYYHKRNNELFNSYEIGDENIKSVRIYKNGKFTIKFKDAETTKKVAEVLIGKNII